MARPAYSFNFVRGSLPVGDFHVEDLGDFVIVVRNIDVYCGGVLLTGATFRLMDSITLATSVYLFIEGTSQNKGAAQWQGREVFEPGYHLIVSVDTPMDVSVSGYKLTP